jgi:hypothetical protein
VILIIPNDDPKAFADAYPTAEVFDTYRGHLSNGGEEIAVYDPNDNLLTSVLYDDDPSANWPVAADGQGHSLEVVRQMTPARQAFQWRLSRQPGGNPGVAELSEQDTDHDGFSDEAEFHSGTDAGDPQSLLRLELAKLDDSMVRLRFSKIAGRTYSLQWRARLDDQAGWQPLLEVPAQATTTLQTIDQVLPAQRRHSYYRLVVRLEAACDRTAP